MAELHAVPPEIQLLQRVYAAFNRREIETVLVKMHPDVDWPNGMEGGCVLGTAAVRDYWKRQFEVLDPRVEPQNFTQKRMDGSRLTYIRWFTTRRESCWWIKCCIMCTRFGMG